MKVSCFELKETGALEPADPEETAARWLAGDGAFQIDLNRYRTRDLQTWLDALDLKPFAKELCLDIGKTIQIIALPDFGFLEVTIFADKNYSRLTNVGLLCLENLLITFHPEPVHTIEESRRLSGKL